MNKTPPRTDEDIRRDRQIGATLAFIRIRDYRQSQAAFAKRLNISRSHLANIESGRTPLSALIGWTFCREFDKHPNWVILAGNSRGENVFPFILPKDAEKLSQFEKMVQSNPKAIFREFWPPLAFLLDIDDEPEPKKALTPISLKSNVEAGMKSEIQKLIERVNQKASKPGVKAALAKELKVAPARISEWLSGKKEPGGNYALRLLNWVEGRS